MKIALGPIHTSVIIVIVMSVKTKCESKIATVRTVKSIVVSIVMIRKFLFYEYDRI